MRLWTLCRGPWGRTGRPWVAHPRPPRGCQSPGPTGIPRWTQPSPRGSSYPIARCTAALLLRPCSSPRPAARRACRLHGAWICLARRPGGKPSGLPLPLGPRPCSGRARPGPRQAGGRRLWPQPSLCRPRGCRRGRSAAGRGHGGRAPLSRSRNRQRLCRSSQPGSAHLARKRNPLDGRLRRSVSCRCFLGGRSSRPAGRRGSFGAPRGLPRPRRLRGCLSSTPRRPSARCSPTAGPRAPPRRSRRRQQHKAMGPVREQRPSGASRSAGLGPRGRIRAAPSRPKWSTAGRRGATALHRRRGPSAGAGL
mmetsp:Transcript_35185/g.83474  ORF Transcript_35185/g.83474 Transcript_35185/m.83474 type:complete len:308 (-) Transcript_35185:256-1179(-)